MIRAIDIVSPERLAKRLATGKYQFNEDGELEKRCSTCLEYWPADEEFFHKGKSRSGNDGLHTMCRDCHCQSSMRSRARHSTNTRNRLEHRHV